MQLVALASTARDLDDARTLFREYADGVAEPCCFASFEQELAGLPGEYAPPGGALLLARANTRGLAAGDGAVAVGCVALRRQDASSGEMKRLYVRDRYRGTGLGRRLARDVIAESRKRGYSRLLLDTLPKMTEAIALYRSLGFRETGPYSGTPTPGAIFFELKLS